MVSLKYPISIPTDGILEIQWSRSSLVAIVKGPCMLTQWNAGFSGTDTFTQVANLCVAGYKVTYFAFVLWTKNMVLLIRPVWPSTYEELVSLSKKKKGRMTQSAWQFAVVPPGPALHFCVTADAENVDPPHSIQCSASVAADSAS